MSRPLRALIILTPLILIVSCSNPASDKPRAVTSDAAPAASQAVAGERYSITPENSDIEFIGAKVTGKHNGSFDKFSGEIQYAGQPEKSSVRITIDVDSMTTDDAKLTAHLKTADFFDVAKFPQATFESTGITPGGEAGATHTIKGNLTMHGVTKSITFPAKIAAAADAITVDATFAINRKDFGINYAGASDNLIRDDVVLTLRVRATK
ncbi:MAG TPA: YceI family protein [Pyrinomonadaceae bacterium]|nr:YceI family protein [Pyrinomonadaceae bacterium]